MESKNHNLIQKYVKQPYPLSSLAADLTLQQTHILVEMMDSVSNKVSAMFESGSKLLFREEDFTDGIAHIDVDFRALTSRPDCYRDVELIATNMSKTQMEYTEQKADGLTKVIINAFESVEIPKEGNRRQGIIRFNLTKRQASSLFDFTRYSKYLKSVARHTSSVYTARIYMLITAWRKFGYWNADYNELRKSLGCNEFDKTTKEWKPKKYAEYRQFKRRVLKTAEDELRKLADNGEVDCWFDFLEIYKEGRVTAHPEKIHFNIHTTTMGVIEDKHQQEVHKYYELQAELQSLFSLTDNECRQVLSKLDDTMVEQFTVRVKEIAKSMERQGDKIRDRRKYALKSLHDTLLDFMPQAEEIKSPNSTFTDVPENIEVNVEQTICSITDADREKWGRVVTQLEGSAIISALQLKADNEGIYIAVPNNLSFEVFNKEIDIIKDFGYRIKK